MTSITSATLADLEAIVALENSSFCRDRFSKSQFRYLLQRPRHAVFKMTCGDTLVGYIILLDRKRSRKLRIYSIGTSPENRRLGYGSRLLDFAQEEALSRNLTTLTLEVCVCNHTALRFYLSHGYTEFGAKDGYYEDGCAALLMKKVVQGGIKSDPSPYKN